MPTLSSKSSSKSSKLETANPKRSTKSVKLNKRHESSKPSKPQLSTELIIACSKCDNEKAMKIIKRGNFQPNFVSMKGNTALLLACTNEMAKVALELAKVTTTSINVEDSSGETALTICAENKKLSRVVTELIKTNLCNLDHRNNREYTALAHAIQEGYEDVAVELIRAGTNLNYSTSDDNITYLHWACSGKLLPVINSLLDIPRSNIDQIDQTNNTALTYLTNQCKNTTNEQEKKTIIRLIDLMETNLDTISYKNNSVLRNLCYQETEDIALLLLNKMQSGRVDFKFDHVSRTGTISEKAFDNGCGLDFA